MEKELFYGGNIITFDGSSPEAVLVEGKKIKKVGKKAEILEIIKSENKVKRTNLYGATLCPSFIDAHGHLYSYAITRDQCSLESCKSFKEIIDTLSAFIKDKTIDGTTWVIGYDYDISTLEEMRHPTKEVLDSVCKYNPCVIIHDSWHIGVCNSVALRLLNITKTTEGRGIGRVSDNDNEPNGYLEDNAFANVKKHVSKTTIERISRLMTIAQDKYLSHGITRCQEGSCLPEIWKVFELLEKNGCLKIDIYAYMDITKYRDFVQNILKNKKDETQTKRLHLAGYSMILDGYPEYNTAWLSGESNCAAGLMTDEDVEKYVNQAKEDGLQLQVQCSGDAAIDQFLRVMEKVYPATEDKKPERPVILQASLATEDQLKRMKSLGITASFIPSQIYYYGDKCIANIGEERADKLFPVASALRNDVHFNFHQNSPSLHPNLLEAMCCACNRLTRAQKQLCEDEKIDVLEALKAITKNSAYSIFAESETGSIEEGKLADFVVLDKNPLSVSANEIKTINVIKTVKEGVTLYAEKDVTSVSACCILI